jgi:lipopolysaccharide export system protein LptC
MMRTKSTISDLSPVDILYQKAIAHSKLVGFLKHALPILGVGIILTFIGLSYVNTVLPEGVVIESAGLEDGKIVMNLPVVAGQNEENQPYRMKALRAVQDIGNSTIITFDEIDAELPMGGGGTAYLTAVNGVFDQANEFLTFEKPLEVTTTAGMIAQFLSAEYDVKSGDFVSNEPVDVKFEGAHISADMMSMSKNGGIVSFQNNVKMTVDPSAIQKDK